MKCVWRIEMLGALRVSSDDATITRFRTRRVSLLLAYLAYYRKRVHYRDEVGELLWPETDPAVARRNLRQALTSLRHAVEPPPLPPGSVLQVQQARLRFNPELVATDVHEFEEAVEEARRRTDEMERIGLLRHATELYRGELLPGYDEEWIVQERLRVEDAYLYALRTLFEHSERLGDVESAVNYLRLSLAKDRLNEEVHLALMRQYLNSARPEAAIRQFDDLRKQLRQELGEEPSDEAYRLRRAAKQEPVRFPPPPESPIPTTAPRMEPEEERSSTTVRLPVVLTRFHGRNEQVRLALDQFTGESRLTTLLGPAGTGKTRLAVEIGRRIAERGDWNVWFVPLADVSNSSMVVDKIQEVTRARGLGGDDFVERLRNTMASSGKNLLILDNLEHIVEEAAPIVGQILDSIPEVRLLTTTRHLLKLEGERQISVPPLPIPAPPDEEVLPEELAQLAAYPSVQLFIDRCQAVRPDFQLTPRNAPAVAAICEKLEGLPLAIELAAGLSGAFPPSQMLLYLERRLTALTSRRRDMPARHRSLRAAIDYSYETLSPPLQRFYSALSVFRGGFEIGAAYSVCSAHDDAQPAEDTSLHQDPHDECLQSILELQERSLLQAAAGDEEPVLRFRMLESFREYAKERLGEADRLRELHAAYYREHPPKPTGPLSIEERTRRHLSIEAEHANYVAAIDFLLEQQDYGGCIDLLGTLASTWTHRGPKRVERRLIRQIADRLESSSVEPEKQILLLRMLGTTYIRSMEYAAALAACQRAMAIAERHGLRDQTVICYTALATCNGYLGRLDECLAMCHRALELAGEDNLPQRERAYLGIGAVHWGLGEMEPAESAYRLAAEISAKVRGGEPDALILANIARVCLDSDRLDEAMVTLGVAIRACTRLRDEFGMAICLTLVSRYHWLKGNAEAALATGREALTRYREADFTHYSLVGLFQQALIFVTLEEWETAAALLAATHGIGRRARLPDERDHEGAIQTIRRKISPTTFERAWAKGLAMDVEEAFRLALRYR